MPTPAEKIAYKRGYASGYSAGVRGRWPEHRPPLPPDGVLAAVVKAASALRDATDAQLAVFDEDDQLVLALGPLVDAFDAAMTRWSEWLRRRDDIGPTA